jgi:hypothetical protein
MTPCSVVKRYQRFGGTFLHLRVEYGSRKFLVNIGTNLENYTTLHPRRTTIFVGIIVTASFLHLFYFIYDLFRGVRNLLCRMIGL